MQFINVPKNVCFKKLYMIEYINNIMMYYIAMYHVNNAIVIMEQYLPQHPPIVL